jgi:tol-pal system protein YbgF
MWAIDDRLSEKESAESSAAAGAQLRRRHAPRLVMSWALLAFGLVAVSGCTTVAEHRKLEERVIDMERNGSGAGVKQRVADNGAEIDELRKDLRMLEGRIEVTEQEAQIAREDARKARNELAMAKVEWQRARRGTSTEPLAGAAQPSGEASGGPALVGAAVIGAGEDEGEQGLSEEIQAYRFAHAAWRSDDTTACVDRFRKFLQTYPASPYADDAAFWMADCHYKQTDFKNAVLRFDDVVRNYPAGNKAPDALFRQGESLLKLGPGYHEAAKRAFERVIKEYPDSERAEEARKQLEVHGAG